MGKIRRVGRMERVMRILGMCVTVGALLGVVGCRAAQRPGGPADVAPTASSAVVGDSAGSLISGGLARTYTLHAPPHYSPAHALPLLLALHGRFGDGQGMVGLTHLNQVADQYGFIVAYPDGYQRSWADGRGASVADKAGVDDVAFLSTLITALSRQYAIDAQRIYVTGISNGGFMTQRLGCDLSARIAAIAVVAATFPVNLAARCAPTHPLPVILMNGTSDPYVPYNGGVVQGDRGEVFSAAQTAAKWAALADCGATPTATTLPTVASDGTAVSYLTYDAGCSQGAQTQFYTITNGGHTWPGGAQYLPVAVVGKASRNLDASQAIWQFCSRYTLAH